MCAAGANAPPDAGLGMLASYVTREAAATTAAPLQHTGDRPWRWVAGLRRLARGFTARPLGRPLVRSPGTFANCLDYLWVTLLDG